MTEDKKQGFKVGGNEGFSDDPEAGFKGDADAYWRLKEAAQGHRFRNVAFFGGSFLTVITSALWVYVIFCHWPDASADNAVVFLFGLKASLTTVVFLTALVSTLRFAIQCYGHHNQQKQEDIAPPNDAQTIIGKAVIAMLKRTTPPN